MLQEIEAQFLDIVKSIPLGQRIGLIAATLVASICMNLTMSLHLALWGGLVENASNFVLWADLSFKATVFSICAQQIMILLACGDRLFGKAFKG